MNIPFNRELDFSHGVVDRLSPLVRRVIAPNAGAFTLFGTGSYIVGSGEVAIVDPGPADQGHIDALLRATSGERISHILVTHTHIDHSPGCALLQRHCDAQTWGMGPHGLGRLQPGDGAGGDYSFVPDHAVIDGQQIVGNGWTLGCVYTPGHSINHMSFSLQAERALLCGDVVMGWSTTIVSPPDGNMTDYLDSLERLMARDDAIYYPSHGAPITNPHSYVEALTAHRMQRVDQVVECLRAGHSQVAQMLPVIYKQLDKSMFPAAAQSVLASLEYLIAKRRVISSTGLKLDSSYQLAKRGSDQLTD